MRLREVQWILRSADEFLTVGSARSRNAGGNVFQTVSNIIPLRQGLGALRTLKAFQRASDELLQHIVFLTASNEAEVSESERNALAVGVSSLRASVTTTLEIISQLLPEESPETFAYRLPTTADASLAEISRQIDIATKIFEQPVKRLTGIDLRVRGFESGSSVVEFILRGANEPAELAWKVSAGALGVKAALNLVARIYAGAKDFASFLLTSAKGLEDLRTMKLKNDLLEQQVKVNTAAADAKISQIAMGICSDETCWAPGASREENPHVLVGRSVSLLAGEVAIGAALQLASNVPASVAEKAPPEALAPAAARKPVPEPAPPPQLVANTEVAGEEPET